MTTAVDKRCAQAVARGVRLLDEQEPLWREFIERDSLALYNCRRCILGQVYGVYSRGLKELDISETQACRFGFNLSPRSATTGEYETLRGLWLEAIGP